MAVPPNWPVVVFKLKPAGNAGDTVQLPVVEPPTLIGLIVLLTPIVNTSGALLV